MKYAYFRKQTFQRFLWPLLLTPFVSNTRFLYPLKTSENRTVFWCFQEVEKGCIEKEEVKRCILQEIKNIEIKLLSVPFLQLSLFRNSYNVFHQRCSVRKGTLRNFAKFTGKHLCKSLSFKVTGMVKLKLAFMEWFFYNLVILIKLYKTRYLNLNKALLFPRNQAIYVKYWKLWRAPTTTKFNIFFWNFAHVSYLTMFSKECLGFFFILFRSGVINKNVKHESVETRSFFIFANNSRSKINKNKSRTPFFRPW